MELERGVQARDCPASSRCRVRGRGGVSAGGLSITPTGTPARLRNTGSAAPRDQGLRGSARLPPPASGEHTAEVFGREEPADSVTVPGR